MTMPTFHRIRPFLRFPASLDPMPSTALGEELPVSQPGRAARWALPLVFLGILLVAAGMRFYRLTSWPPPHVDEVIGGVSALDLEFSSRLIEPSFTHYLPIALLPQTAAFELLGVSMFTLRLVSVLCGIGAVACIYWAGRSLFSPTAGLIAAGILATSHIVVAISRLGGMNNSQAIFLSALCLATFGQAARSGGWWWVAWGASIGIGVYSYEGFRAIPVAIALALLFQPRLLWSVRKGVLAAFVASLAVAAPLLIVSASDPQKYFEESRQLSVFSKPDDFKALHHVDSMEAVLKKQFELSIRYFFEGRNRDTQYMFRGAGLDPGTQALIVAGLIVAAVRIRRLAYRTLLFCVALGLIGNTITESPPLVPRLSLLMPAGALLMAAPLGEIAGKLFRGNLGAGCLAAALVTAALFVPHYTYYFRDYNENDVYWSWIEPNRSIGQYIAKLDPDDRVYLLRTPGVWREHAQLRFALLEAGRDSSKVEEIPDWDKNDFTWSQADFEKGAGDVYVIAPPEGSNVLTSLRLLCLDAAVHESVGHLHHLGPRELQFTAVRLQGLDCVQK